MKNKKLEEKMFSGENSEQLNVLMQALRNAADDGDVYNFMENTPKTSFIVHLSDEIKELGFAIKKIK